jgi:hypothetical protein
LIDAAEETSIRVNWLTPSRPYMDVGVDAGDQEALFVEPVNVTL